MSGFNLQAYHDDHFETCINLFHEVFVQTYPDLDEQFLLKARFHSIFKDWTLPNSEVFIGMHDTEVVGFIAIAKNCIDQLYIRQDFQGKGLGSLMVNKAKELFPGKLELYTLAQNQSAIAFYEKHGFEIVQHGIAPDEKVPDVLMRWEG